MRLLTFAAAIVAACLALATPARADTPIADAPHWMYCRLRFSIGICKNIGGRGRQEGDMNASILVVDDEPVVQDAAEAADQPRATVTGVATDTTVPE